MEMLEVKSDERGDLFEAFKFPNDGQVFVVNIRPFATRGNHYHTHKTERFLVVKGSADIKVWFGKSEHEFTVSPQDPAVITIEPGWSHNITAGHNGCLLLVWVNEQFDPEDADTFPAVTK